MLTVLALGLALACLQDADYDRRHREATARHEAWMEPLGERITELLPKPIDGLTSNMPWDVEADHPPIGSCLLGCSQYVQLRKEREFVVAEPALIAKVEATEKDALDAALKVNPEKLDEKLLARIKTLEESVEQLKRSARRVEVAIHVNAMVTEPRGTERAGVPAGTIAGYPVYRFAFDDESYAPTPSGVRFAVGLGPVAFKNPKVDPAKMIAETKTIVVSVAVQSRRDTVKSDEALIRKFLETVDYQELAKLLK